MERIQITDEDMAKLRAAGWYMSKAEAERFINLDLTDPINLIPELRPKEN